MIVAQAIAIIFMSMFIGAASYSFGMYRWRSAPKTALFSAIVVLIWTLYMWLITAKCY